MSIETKLEQLWNDELPIYVTELGMVTEVNPVQFEKALSPILVTELGMVIEDKPRLYAKALLPILVTPYVIDAFVTVAGIFAMPVMEEFLITSTVGGLVDVTL